jgi:hypothetical protein
MIASARVRLLLVAIIALGCSSNEELEARKQYVLDVARADLERVRQLNGGDPDLECVNVDYALRYLKDDRSHGIPGFLKEGAELCGVKAPQSFADAVITRLAAGSATAEADCVALARAIARLERGSIPTTNLRSEHDRLCP